MCSFALTTLRRYMIGYLTTFMLQTPPKIVEMLTEIKKMTGILMYVSLISPYASDVEERSAALSQAAFLCDPNTLYDKALETCDVDLVEMIAQKTQKDPRVYLPFFQTLRDAPDENQRRYLIHHSLRHYYIAGYYLWYGACAFSQSLMCLNVLVADAVAYRCSFVTSVNAASASRSHQSRWCSTHANTVSDTSFYACSWATCGRI